VRGPTRRWLLGLVGGSVGAMESYLTGLRSGAAFLMVGSSSRFLSREGFLFGSLRTRSFAVGARLQIW
jgi:hypothetical protein